MNGAKKIRDIITACPRGTIFFPEDFSFVGGTKLVTSALTRLCDAGTIVRISQGIYCYPKIDEKWGMGILTPSLDEIAQAISTRDKSRITPTGAQAMNILGLSTQLQTNVVYYTDGSSRTIKIGNGKGILFKHSSNMKIFAFRSKLMQLIVATLKEIGNGRVSEDEKAKLRSHLKNVEQNEFTHDLDLAPIWVQKILKDIV